MPVVPHTQTMILLHGRDSAAQDFASEFFESQASDNRTLMQIFPGMKWVFPSAPELRSERFDCNLPQWFDMWDTENPHEREDQQQLDTQVSRIQKIIADEAAVIGSDNLFVAGISQGCAIGIHALLTQDRLLAGFIGLSSWLPKHKELRRNTVASALSTPIFLGHCEDDEVIAVKHGQELRDRLRDMGVDVRWHSYEAGGHWLNEAQGVNDIVMFVDRLTR